jgi:DNA-binding MarR family transcriptional regulator
MLFITEKIKARANRIVEMMPTMIASMAKFHQDQLLLGEEDEPTMIKRGKKFSFSITFNQYLALMIINDMKECSVNDIADCMKIAQSTASQLTDRLVKANLVQRDIHYEDRRKMVVKLTLEGKDMVEKRTKSLKKSYARILLALDEKDQEILEDGFKKLHYISMKLDEKTRKCFLGIKHN